MPDLNIILVSLIAIGTFILFIIGKLRPDVVAILSMCLLMLTGLVTPEEGVSGFGNPAVITIMAMLILSAAVQRTGLIHTLGHKLFSLVGNNIMIQILIIALIVVPLSAFISNTATVAVMIPLVFALARMAKVAVSKTLIPLSYLSQLGGMLTIIGTSPNIIANSLLTDFKLPAFSIFALTGVAAIALAVGLFYLLTLGFYLLPSHEKKNTDTPEIFFAQAKISSRSKFIGKKITEIKKFPPEIKVVEIIRGSKFIRQITEVELAAQDIIIFQAPQEVILQMLNLDGIEILCNFNPDRHHFNPATQRIARLAIISQKAWIGRPLDQVDFRDRYHANIIGVNYSREPSSGNLRHQSLCRGDIILVAANRGSWSSFHHSPDFILLDEVMEMYHPEKIWLVLTILVGVILTAALNLLPIVVSALTGVVLLILTRCLPVKEIYKTVNWEIIFLLAGLIPLGIALQNTGMIEILGTTIADIAGNIPPLLLLILFYLATTFITEMISNVATVILFVPIAITTALQLGHDPLPFVIMVMFGASTAFITPIGYQTNTMVYTAGNYKFTDFMRVGLPLNLLLTTIVPLVVYFWMM